MATVNYNPVSNVEPEAIQPVDPYRRIHVDPDMFGAGIGRALEGLGQTVGHLGQVWGEVQADSAVNNAYDQITKIRTGFTNLQGQDALNAQKDTEAQINDVVKSGRSGLFGPSAMEYDRQVRRLAANSLDYMANHAQQQGREYANSVNKTTQENSLSGIGADPTNAMTFDFWRDKATHAAIKDLGLKGIDTPDARDAAIARVNMETRKQQIEALAVSDPVQASGLADKYKAELTPQIYDTLHKQLEGAVNKAQGDAGFARHYTAAVNAPPSSSAPNVTPAAEGDASVGALRHFEGFRDTAYWDVNHWRVGYGSDTITKPDGTVESVSQGTKVSQADADRDLNRRVRDTQNKIAFQVGEQNWGGLGPQQQAALTSMAYNYGALPFDVQAAVRGGAPPAVVASAILNHQNDNGGVNRARRQQEAAAMNGGKMPTGYVTSGGSGGTVPALNAPEAMPDIGAPHVQEAAFNPDEGPTAQPAVSTIPEGSEGASLPRTAEDIHADTVRRIMEDSSLSDGAKKVALGQAEMTYKMAQIASEQDAKAKKHKADQATNHVYNVMDQGNYTGAYTAANQALDSGLIDDKQYDTLSRLIDKRSGQEGDPRSYGPSFNDIFKQMLLPVGTPGRINTASDIYNAEIAGQLTPKGTQRLLGVLGNLDKPDEYGLNKTIDANLTYAKKTLNPSAEQAALAGEMPDTKAEAYVRDFTDQYMSAIGRAKEKDPTLSGSPVLTRKFVDDLINQISHPADRAKAALLQQQKNADAGGTDPRAIPPPPGVQADLWPSVVAAVPVAFAADGSAQPLTTDIWAQAITKLVQNPTPKTKENWNKRYPGHDAQSILGALGVEPGPKHEGGAPSSPIVSEPMQLPGAEPASPVGTPIEPYVQPGQPMPGMAVSP